MYRKTVLENGMKVLTEEIAMFKSATIGMWVNVGSGGENRRNNGISHFMEHMMFKGTRRHSATQLAEIMDSVGGNLNAITDKEQTCYYARVVDRHIPLALDLLAEMLLESLFDPVEIEREKNVILEEIRMYEDSPDELIFDIFTQAIWKNHPLGQATLGTRQTTSSFCRDDFLGYLNDFYAPDNMIVCAAGNVRHDDIVARISSLFGGQRRKRKATRQTKPTVHVEHVIRHKDCEQTHVCMGGEGVCPGNEDKYKLMILDSLLGGSMSSRLFQEIRERRGLVYNVFSFTSSFVKGGLLGVYAGTSNANLPKVLKLIRRILREMRGGAIRKKDFVRAKEHLKGAISLGLESTSNRMIRLAKSEMYHGRLVPHEEVFEKLDGVTHEQVCDIAEKFLDDEKFTITVLGPTKGAVETLD